MMDTMHLFAGGGGGMLADLQLGHSPRVAVEIDPFCRQVLARRFPNCELHDDIRTFQASAYRGRIDIVAGGFPCQDISVAGKGEGLKGARSSLWSEMLRVVGEVRPRYAFIENAPVLRTRGLETILRDLCLLGYDAAWTVLSAEDVGAPHLRKRMWILATDANRKPLRHDEQRQAARRHDLQASGEGQFGHNGGERRPEEVAHPESFGQRPGLQPDQPAKLRRGRSSDGSGPGPAEDTNANSGRCEGFWEPVQGGVESPPGTELDRLRAWRPCEVSFPGGARLEVGQWTRSQWAHAAATGGGWWATEPEVGRVVAGVASRVVGPGGLTASAYRAAQVKALGNGQVPAQAAAAYTFLREQLETQ
jgi:DNA (cytosine-5)-methyltransferase 1